MSGAFGDAIAPARAAHLVASITPLSKGPTWFASRSGNGLAECVDLLENHLAAAAGLTLRRGLVGEVALAGIHGWPASPLMALSEQGQSGFTISRM
jgi:hypothetical protein